MRGGIRGETLNVSQGVYNCAYVLTKWDPGKARLNATKHGVSFADAVASLEDEGALTMRDPFSDDEERWVTMGLDCLGRVLVIVHTWRGECTPDFGTEGDSA